MRPAHFIVNAEAYTRVEKVTGLRISTCIMGIPLLPGVSKRNGVVTSTAQCLACSNVPAGFLFPLCHLLTLGSSPQSKGLLYCVLKGAVHRIHVARSSTGCHGERLSLIIGGSGAWGRPGLMGGRQHCKKAGLLGLSSTSAGAGGTGTGCGRRGGELWRPNLDTPARPFNEASVRGLSSDWHLIFNYLHLQEP